MTEDGKAPQVEREGSREEPPSVEARGRVEARAAEIEAYNAKNPPGYWPNSGQHAADLRTILSALGEAEAEVIASDAEASMARAQRDIQTRQALAALSEASTWRERAERAEDFIFDIGERLHSERVADWYPEGANNSALAMSESMRLIGNDCADFGPVLTGLGGEGKQEFSPSVDENAAHVGVRLDTSVSAGKEGGQ